MDFFKNSESKRVCMPLNGSVGQSDYTSTKQQHFAMVVQTHLRVAKGIFQKNKSKNYQNWIQPQYLYVDFYAGSGVNHDNVLGSPVIFMNQARKVGVSNIPIFIEENEYTAQQLNIELRKRGATNFEVVTGNNQDHIRAMINNPPASKQIGLAYLDPNGIPDFSLIKELSEVKQYEKFDFLINCPATAIKRAKGVKTCKQEKNLIEELVSINKSYWIIREPIGRWQWTFLIGTNWNAFPNFKNLGFWPLSSPQGRRIAMNLSYSSSEIQSFEKNGWYQDYKEYLAHPFFKLVRKEVMAKSYGNIPKYKKWGNVCQACGNEFATEVHHNVYCKWHEFDVPENLIAVCHQCHCKIHNKEN